MNLRLPAWGCSCIAVSHRTLGPGSASTTTPPSVACVSPDSNWDLTGFEPAASTGWARDARPRHRPNLGKTTGHSTPTKIRTWTSRIWSPVPYQLGHRRVTSPPIRVADSEAPRGTCRWGGTFTGSDPASHQPDIQTFGRTRFTNAPAGWCDGLPSLSRPGDWPTATECSCGLVVGCGLSSSTHELGSAWHQCRQRDARAGFEPAFSRGCWPCGIPLPHPALCPDISRRGGKEKARGSLWDSRAAVWELRPLFGLPFPHVSIYQTTALHSILRYGFFVSSSHVSEPEGGDLPPERFDFSVGFDDSTLVPL